MARLKISSYTPNTAKRRAKVLSGAHDRRSHITLVPARWQDFARQCSIRSGKNIIPFDPYDFQIQLSNALDRVNSLLVAKTRQLGITETIACKFLHWAAGDPGFACVILSKSQSDSSEIAKRVRKMISSVPYLHLKTDNLTDLEIEGGGRLIFRPSTPSSTRGLPSIGAVLIDECAFVNKVESIYTAVIPAMEMSENPKTVLVSTPNGASGFFWDNFSTGNGDLNVLEMCDRVRSSQIAPYQEWIDDSGWVNAIVHWKAHPVYSQRPNYLETIARTKKLSMEAVNQEYNLAFASSTVNVFDLMSVERATTEYLEHYYDEYYLGIDPNFGGADFCVALVLGLRSDGTYEVVEMFREQEQTFGFNIAGIGVLLDRYHPARVGIETNSGGSIYAEQLAREAPGLNLEGIRTSEISKPLLVDRIKLFLENERLVFEKSSPLKDELTAFRREGRKLSAPAGRHDDCVMALAIALAVCPESDPGVHLIKKALDNL